MDRIEQEAREHLAEVERRTGVEIDYDGAQRPGDAEEISPRRKVAVLLALTACSWAVALFGIAVLVAAVEWLAVRAMWLLLAIIGWAL